MNEEPITCPRCGGAYFSRVHRVAESRAPTGFDRRLVKFEEPKTPAPDGYAGMRADTPRFQCAACGAIVAVWDGGEMLVPGR